MLLNCIRRLLLVVSKLLRLHGAVAAVQYGRRGEGGKGRGKGKGERGKAGKGRGGTTRTAEQSMYLTRPNRFSSIVIYKIKFCRLIQNSNSTSKKEIFAG